jgi:hypothetical protein
LRDKTAFLQNSEYQTQIALHARPPGISVSRPAIAGHGTLVMHLIFRPYQANPLRDSPPVSLVATDASRLLLLTAAGSVYSIQVPSGAVARSTQMSSGRTCGRALAFSPALQICAVIGDGNDSANMDADDSYSHVQPSVALYHLRGRSPKLMQRFQGRPPGNTGNSRIKAWRAELSPDAMYLAIFTPACGTHIILTSTAACCTISRPDVQQPDVTVGGVENGSTRPPLQLRITSIAWPRQAKARLLWSDGTVSVADLPADGTGGMDTTTQGRSRLQPGSCLACVQHLHGEEVGGMEELATIAMEPEWGEVAGSKQVCAGLLLVAKLK